jgi:hypothetical protein
MPDSWLASAATVTSLQSTASIGLSLLFLAASSSLGTYLVIGSFQPSNPALMRYTYVVKSLDMLPRR